MTSALFGPKLQSLLHYLLLLDDERKWPGRWLPMIVSLKDGINRVIIEGKRAAIGDSGINIDEVEIYEDQYFRKT